MRLRDMNMPNDTTSVGAVEGWADDVHTEIDTGEPRAMTTGLVPRVVHGMRCMVVYVRTVLRYTQREQRVEAARRERRRKALWDICAMLVREYKQRKQEDTLEARKAARLGRVCAHTRNVGRLGPKGGVVYDETRRNRPRVQVGDRYTLKRWPRRDKHGPTLARILHYLWGIT